MGQNLSQEELDYISEQSGIENDIIKSWHKDFIKLCPTGKMDKKQFYKFYKILRGQADEENLAKITDHVFKCFDKDSNGSLSFSEFIIAYSSTSNSDIIKKLEFVFLFYDSNRDGFITDKEILKGVELMYEFKKVNRGNEYTPEAFVRDIFKKMDKNGDRKLSKDEFIHECLNNHNVLDLLSPFEF